MNTNMNIAQRRMALIFNEWARRYALNPSDFDSILDSNGTPISDYGESCTFYFEKIANELEVDGKLPRPEIN